ncbi:MULTISPECIES: hypothetical protein [unclassified Streptomyces]|uniref:hypothetical protein n=1 Tax=unclassified Streptomyces TaxID=2593676 RepID=UPI002255425E|nr:MULTISPECIES: hypothetical protein [unclassified Streptomyces]MCX5049666.1 hypothetical protein [Streptomyces sp. NBC_00474]MCX5055608.1 hypothetical protein [Streptomyces sp. NBC_00452]MCX5247546.1 hypothetical protein [Streptomyces sp. NBC_00201]
MTRTPHRVLLASVLSLGTLVGASACSLGAQVRAQTPAPSRSAKPAPTRTTPPSSRPLTEAQAHAALVTEGDLGAPWGPTQGVATWRDGVLKATAQAPDCRRLLDALYTDDLFGAASGPRAVTGLDDSMDQAQLRYQVLALSPADVDRTLAWMKTLPATCGRFTAVTDYGSVQDVQVSDAELPEVGDARQGLRLTFAGRTTDGEPTMLTLDVVAVRIGDDTIALTHGGPGMVSADATRAFVQVGAQRLADVRKQARLRV